MRIRDVPLAAALTSQLTELEKNLSMPGLAHQNHKAVFVEQLVDSVRRVRYVETIAARAVSHSRLDPHSDTFDPIRAASHYGHIGQTDEGCWLVFLAIHFGRHADTGWRLCQDIYAGASAEPWTWSQVIANAGAFDTWLHNAHTHFQADGIARRFGNHRKYETLRADSPRALYLVAQSYLDWVGPTFTHQTRIDQALHAANGNGRLAFRLLYTEMDVLSFGRTAKFDYLTMLGKLGLAQLEADSTYMSEATGPRRGAKFLFFGNTQASASNASLERKVAMLEGALELGAQGMQVLEDAICNWQKSPDAYLRFR